MLLRFVRMLFVKNQKEMFVKNQKIFIISHLKNFFFKSCVKGRKPIGKIVKIY